MTRRFLSFDIYIGRHGVIMELSHHGFCTVNISAIRHVEKCHFAVDGGGGGGRASRQSKARLGSGGTLPRCDEVGHNLSSVDAVDALIGFGNGQDHCCLVNLPAETGRIRAESLESSNNVVRARSRGTMQSAACTNTRVGPGAHSEPLRKY